ncbi:MAG: hypothetical protein DRJ98_07935 [Thermoprotei archaeon]|nr:MAG: hypothetical protein DRJ98_07935 [Thermoprotei archaeon]
MKEFEELCLRLEKTSIEPRVTVMPDFFLDRIVRYNANLEGFIEDVKRIASQGGGSLGFKRQLLIRGGNAANMAAAIAMLGARVTLILRTSWVGLKLLEIFMPSNVDLSRVKCDGELSMTVALELVLQGRLCNIMISDPGSLALYGPEDLDAEDYEAIASSDFVCVFNWTSNKKGTQLAEEVFRRAKETGKAKTFMDTADPSQRAEEIPEFIKRVFKRDLLDALGVNENEARWYARYLVRESQEDPLKCAEILHRELGLRVDLHTVDYAATLEGGELYLTPTFNVKPLRATGAGDAWNAGNIYGWALGLKPKLRLLLANAVAAYYITSPDASHPTRFQVANFLRGTVSLKDLPTRHLH